MFANRNEKEVVAQMLRIKCSNLHIVIQEPQTVCPNKIRKKKPPLDLNNIPKSAIAMQCSRVPKKQILYKRAYERTLTLTLTLTKQARQQKQQQRKQPRR